MKHLACPCMLAIILAAAGCEKRGQGMTAVIDRDHHQPDVCFGFGPAPRAYDAPDRGGHAHDGVPVDAIPIGSYPWGSEEWYTLRPGENLCDVADLYNVDLLWLIKRSDIRFEKEVVPGLKLIVPLERLPVQ